MSDLITVEVQGQTHSGLWKVSGDTITVQTLHGSKTAQVAQSPPETLAWLMLLELVREEKAARVGRDGVRNRRDSRPSPSYRK